MTLNSTTSDISDYLAEQLCQDPNYRVIRRLQGDSLFISAFPENAGLAIVLDTETTGTGDADRLIELGMVSFAYDRSTGEVFGAVDRFDALEDPGMPIPPEATAVNGITDDMVAGCRIDDAAVQAMVERADFVIAHNARFDRPVCERRFPFFKETAWACSLMQVNWAASGITSAKLEYIAYRLGFFYDAHRAEVDCLALLHALRLPLGTGPSAMSQILVRQSEVTRRIWAINAPYDAKDLLKYRGYRWSDGSAPDSEKAWFIEVLAEELDQELVFLKQEVYSNRPLCLPVDIVNAASRFSSRRGLTERLYR